MPTLQTYLGVYLWRYIPSLPLATAFAILFGLVTTAHIWRMVKTRMWFCIPFVVGGLCEEIGYIARAAANDATGSLAIYIIQAIFLLLPPVLFAASLYMVYSRVVRAVHGESLSPISPRRATIIFVLGDFTCLNIQSTGGGMLSHPSQAAIGDDIIVTGLILQVLMFVCFMICCVTFHTRFRARVAETGGAAADNIPWESCLHMLYGTSVAILVRNVYRVVEFIMGQDGYLQSNEWPTYVFDAALMFLVMVGFFIWYPSHLEPRARDSRDSRDSAMELTARDRAGFAEDDQAAKHTEPML